MTGLSSSPRSACTLGVCVLLLVGCGVDRSNASTEPLHASSLSQLQSDVFSRSCALSGSCHRGPTQASNLDLEPPLYEKLVGVAPTEDATRVLIVPFEPDASFLYEKLALEHPTVGERMPLNQPLPPEVVARVRAWIAAGAKND